MLKLCLALLFVPICLGEQFYLTFNDCETCDDFRNVSIHSDKVDQPALTASYEDKTSEDG